MTKECRQCHRHFPKPDVCSVRAFREKRFSCSLDCDREWRKANKERYRSSADLSGLEIGRKWWKGKKREKTWNKGRAWPDEVKEKLRQANLRQKNIVRFTAGEAHPNWKGGTTRLVVRLRNAAKYKEWRSAVFKRDDFTCRFCDQRGGKLNADHITAFSAIIQANGLLTYEKAMACDALWDVKNGRTLCEPCHRKTPTFARNARHQSR